MRLISHRGNTIGRNPELENNPLYIDKTLNENFDVEIDLWVVDGQLYLGHDNPDYIIQLSWLLERKDKLWIHCKNVEAIRYMNVIRLDFNYFWHENDLMTLTSKEFLWVFPGKQPIGGSIAVLPELHEDDISQCLGICSDFIKKYETEY